MKRNKLDPKVSKIKVTKIDLERIEQTLETYGQGRLADACEALEMELARAEVVESTEVPPDVVTMNSIVSYADETTGKTNEITLVYPQHADISEGKVSLLAPIGTALLGLQVGQSLPWPLPDGRFTTVKVMAVRYQPEAMGHYHL